MEPLIDDTTEKSPRTSKSKNDPELERAKLGKLESAKVGAWLRQLEESFKGFLQLSKSDLVNFIIRERRDELTPKEISQIRSYHYDPIRHLNWITPRLKDALSSGDIDQISRLQGEIRSIELSVIAKATAGDTIIGEPKPKRTRRRKRSSETESQGSDPPADARNEPE